MAPPLCDREGAMWIATSQGLLQFIPHAFTFWEAGSEPYPEKMLKVSEDGEGRLWFAGEKEVYSLSPGETVIQQATERFMPLTLVGNPNGWGAWAIASNHHFYRIVPQPPNSGVEDAQPLRKGVFPSSPLCKTKDGTVWSASRDGVIRVPSGSLRNEIVDVRDSEGRLPEVRQIVANAGGKVLFSVPGEGVFPLNGTVLGKRLNPDPLDPIAVCVGPDDRIWVASAQSSGIGFFDPVSDRWFFAGWKELDLPFDLPDRYGLAFDRANGLWITSPRGVLRANRQEVSEAIQEGGSSPDWRSFDRGDGLPTIACSDRPDAAHVDSKGRLWIPTDAGVAMTDPQFWTGLKHRIPPPHVELTELRVDEENRDFGTGEVMKIPAEAATLEVEFNALHYSSPEQIRYRYRLYDYDKEWIAAGNVGQAHFRRPPPGDYRFEVMADNGFGVWPDEPVTLGVSVLPYWWERGLVRAVGVLLLIATVIALFLFRTNEIRKKQLRQEAFSQQLIEAQEGERKRIASELHDELGQDLLLIKATSELAAKGVSEDSPVHAHHESIGNLAQQAIDNVRGITANLRPLELERLGLVAAVRSMCQQADESSDIEVNYELEALHRAWDASKQLDVFRILQEGLNNALKHANATRVAVLAIEHGSRIDLVIQDDGDGMDPKAANSSESGMGLQNIRERSRILGADFEIVSTPGNGTCLTIRIPTTDSSTDV